MISDSPKSRTFFGNHIVINKIALGVMLLLGMVMLIGLFSIVQEKNRTRLDSLKGLEGKAEIVDAVLLGEREKLQIVSSIVEELTAKLIHFFDYNKIPSIEVMLQEISAKQKIDIVLFFDERYNLLATNNFTSFPRNLNIYTEIAKGPIQNVGVYALPTSVANDFDISLHTSHSVFYSLALKSIIPLIDDVGDASGYVVLLKILSCNEIWIHKLRDILATDFVFFDNRKNVLFSSFRRHDISYPTDQQLETGGRTYLTKAIPFSDTDKQPLGELVILKDNTKRSAGVKRELLKLILPVILALILFVATIEDTTKRRRAEQELAESHKFLEETVKKRTLQLETANRELKDFAYIVSHDLKAPLRAISQLSGWIAEDHRDVLSDDGREQLELLLNRVRRMHSLIEGILQYSRIGRVRETVVKINTTEMVEEVVNLIGIPNSVRVVIDRDLPVIWAERIRIFQVFQNLLSNSLKFMDKAEGMVVISGEEDEECCHFTVTDNGPGIKEAYFDKVFQIFQCLTPRDEYESTGIGLSLVKKIVSLYNGKVWIESVVGEGAAFHFTLDRAIVGDKPEYIKKEDIYLA